MAAARDYAGRGLFVGIICLSLRDDWSVNYNEPRWSGAMRTKGI